ncbi:hypothetical protein D9M68_586670 [compost metagenome]
MVLQGLAQIGDFTRAFIEDDGLAEEVPFKVLADEVNLWTQLFQQQQAIIRRGQQLVELDQRLIQLAGRFADIGLRQAGDPAFQVARSGVTERQALLVRGRYAEQQVGTLFIHLTRILQRQREGESF